MATPDGKAASVKRYPGLIVPR